MRELENRGPTDRLLGLPDGALELLHVSEGAVDHMIGTPLDCNPYADEGHDSPRFQSWRRGWLDGCRWRDLREAEAPETQLTWEDIDDADTN